MSSTIKTYDDLVIERERLKAQLAFHKQQVTANWSSLKHEFEPVNQAFGALGRIAKGDKSNPLINMGLQLVGDMFIKNFVLAKAGWITRLAVPFVMKNYSSHLLADKGRGFVEKLSRFLKGRHNGHHTAKPE
ncbi:MAG: hypothetical protein ABI415_03275 [Flavitalea sp.]